jgi:uncharacterized protein (TIGR02186 family)
MIHRGLLLLVVAAAIGVASPAAAERLVVSLSTHRVLINSNFTGADLVLFGSIDDIDPDVLARGGYDVVVTVRGPKRSFIARRKQQIFGVWVNTESREFVSVPAYLSVSSNRAPAQIARPDLLRRLAIGLNNNMLRQRIGADLADVQPEDPFRAGFIGVKTAEGLFREEPNGVTYLGTNLFRTAVPIPGPAPTGTYEVETVLLAGGALITRETTAIEVTKEGFEAVVAQAARDERFGYGLGTALLALLAGLFASLAFRRD